MSDYRALMQSRDEDHDNHWRDVLATEKYGEADDLARKFGTKERHSMIEIGEVKPNTHPVSIDGKEVGKVEYDACMSEPNRWHAAISVPGDGLPASLAQGFGPTAAQAVQNAFERGRAGAEEYLAELAKLRAAAYPDTD